MAGARYNDIVLNASGNPVGAARVYVGTSSASGTPLSPLATVYSDSTLITPIAQPIIADSLGNFGFWTSPGTYTLQISGTSATYNESITVGSGAGGNFDPTSVTDPYVDARTHGVDCTGLTDSRAAFVAALTANHPHLVFPAGCKVKIQASGGLGAVATGISGLGNNGWNDIDGNNTQIFGCGAGTGAVVNLNRSGYFRFHGFTIQPGDTTLCPTGSTFTRALDWTNNGGGGTTSTSAEFYDLSIKALGAGHPGGQLFPTVGSFGIAANAGNNVVYSNAFPSWTGMGIFQVTATNVVNTTSYSTTVQAAIGGSCCGTQFTGEVTIALAKCTANCTPGITSYAVPQPTLSILGGGTATQSCAVSTVNTWTPCTVNYTGTVGDAGSAIVVLVKNTSTVASGKQAQLFFDNITNTGISISNPSFETTASGIVLGSGGQVYPSPGASWNWVGYGQFVGLQVGSTFNETNLEALVFKDSSVDGGNMPGSIAFLDIGCCSEHGVIENVAVLNVYRGITGQMGGVIRNLYGDIGIGESNSNYQAYGIAGGASIAISSVATELLTIDGITNDGTGVLLNTNFGTATNNSIVMINPQIVVGPSSPGAMASTEYSIDTSNIGQLTLVGGYAQNPSGAAIPNSENAFIGPVAGGATGNHPVFGANTVTFLDASLSHGEKLIGSTHVDQRGLIARGSATLGTGAISSATCATVVTVSAPGVNGAGLTDSISFAFTTAPSGAYTQGLFIQPYTTTDNVNFLVCNPTAGSLTPPAKTLSWSVSR